MKKEQLKEYVENYSLTYDYEDDYCNLYNACIDYMNDTQDWCLEEVFEDYITYDTAEEIAKGELKKGGLIRLYYFLGVANLNNTMFRIDGYGNLQDFTSEDLEDIRSEILDRLED